jgi:hypothetical protein
VKKTDPETGDSRLEGGQCFPTATGHSIIASVLGFLLVFRTNICYQKFKDGRDKLGGVVNASRDMATFFELNCFTNDEKGKERVFEFRRKLNLCFGFVRQLLRESRHGFRPKNVRSIGGDKIENTGYTKLSNAKQFAETNVKWADDSEPPLMKDLLRPGELERFAVVPVGLRPHLVILDLHLMVKHFLDTTPAGKNILDPQQFMFKFEELGINYMNQLSG